MTFDQLKDHWNQVNGEYGERYAQRNDDRHPRNTHRSAGRRPPPKVDQSAGCEFL